MIGLFFYGVLIAGIAPPPVQRLLAGIGCGRPATARGLLWAVDGPAGAHPAMTVGEGTVTGVLHAAGRVDLAALDAFEGADYSRTPIAVRCADTIVSAEAYLWIAPTVGLKPIAGGDFVRWLGESGRPAFGY